MTHETRTPADIERDIERDRAQLTDNIETLQDKLSIDGLIGQVSDQLRTHGGDIGQSLSRTVKDNPAAVALTGIGLAWMIFGNKKTTVPEYRSTDRHYSENRREMTVHGGSTARPDPSFKGESAGLPSWADGYSENDANHTERLKSGVDHVRDNLSSARSNVNDYADAARTSLSSTSDQAKDKASRAAQQAKHKAADLRARLSEGTEALSKEARDRVIAAREAALDARDQAAQAVSRSSEQAADFYDRQPMVMGAVALAVGAAIGAAAPRTRKEDALMGAHSDQMMRNAERIFEEEREKAASVLSSVKNEAENVLKEKKADLQSGAPAGKTVPQAIADEATAAGKRIADTAKAEANAKDLGKVSS